MSGVLLASFLLNLAVTRRERSVLTVNYTPMILEQLGQGKGFAEILLTPGAKPIVREPTGLRAFGELALKPEDVLETLTTLISRLPTSSVGLEKEGVFSFGLPNRGRFRVSYLTQRGSYAMSISEIPLVVPELETLWADPAMAREWEGRILDASSGLIVLAGAPPMAVNTLAYSLLKKVNDMQDRVIFTLEPCITYMLKHNKSVVLQSEVGGDVASIEDGVQAALNLSPHIVYVRGIASESDLKAVLKAVKFGVLAVITVSHADVPTLFPSDRSPIDLSLMQGIWHFELSHVPGQLLLKTLEDAEPVYARH